jgi:hypothetical protein
MTRAQGLYYNCRIDEIQELFDKASERKPEQARRGTRVDKGTAEQSGVQGAREEQSAGGGGVEPIRRQRNLRDKREARQMRKRISTTLFGSSLLTYIVAALLPRCSTTLGVMVLSGVVMPVALYVIGLSFSTQ